MKNRAIFAAVVAVIFAGASCTTTLLPKKEGVEIDCMRRVHTPPLGAKKRYVPGDKYLTKTTYPAACGGVVDYQKQFEAAYEQLQIAEPGLRENKQPLVLAHYMPWFQKYGYHWQEGGANFDPAQILPNGRCFI